MVVGPGSVILHRGVPLPALGSCCCSTPLPGPRAWMPPTWAVRQVERLGIWYAGVPRGSWYGVVDCPWPVGGVVAGDHGPAGFRRPSGRSSVTLGASWMMSESRCGPPLLCCEGSRSCSFSLGAPLPVWPLSRSEVYVAIFLDVIDYVVLFICLHRLLSYTC